MPLRLKDSTVIANHASPVVDPKSARFKALERMIESRMAKDTAKGSNVIHRARKRPLRAI